MSTSLATKRAVGYFRVSSVGQTGAIRSFLEDFQNLDVQHQKAQLQAILKAVHVYRDDRIEVEFRG